MKKSKYIAPKSKFFECETEEVIAQSYAVFENLEDDYKNGDIMLSSDTYDEEDSRATQEYRVTLWGD